ncbi:MAG: STAS domain-containing protein [Candidatus Geothermincolales bacterium]
MDEKDKADSGLKVAVEDLGDISLVSLVGEVDVYTAPKLKDAINSLVERGRYHIVVDLEKVVFLDSTGLGVLVGGLKKVKSNEGELGIICNQERILRVFRITGLTKVFPVYRNRDEIPTKERERQDAG